MPQDKIVKANGKTFTFPAETSDEEIGIAIDDYFNGNTEEVKKKNWVKHYLKRFGEWCIRYSES